MATISINFGNDPILSMYNINTIKFDFDRGAATGTYAKLVVDGYSFFATKTGTVGNVDSYTIDLSNILKNLLPLPPTNPAVVSDLFASKTFTVNGYSSVGAVLATSSFDSYITYGYTQIGVDYGYLMIYGGRSVVFHHGTICFWFDGTAGTHTVTVGAIGIAYSLVHGWNRITLHYTQWLSSTLSINSGGASVIFDVVYRNISNENIDWLNSAGCWDSWAGFTKINTSHLVEVNTSVPIYNQAHVGALGYDRAITRSKILRISFECIALNAVQYAQFVAMQESQVIIYNAGIWRVAESNNLIADCRQNLNFKITLERVDNVASY